MTGMTTNNKPPRLKIPEMVGLLRNQRFLKDSEQLYVEGSQWHQKFPTNDTWNQHWPEFWETAIGPFISKWGVWPPPYELLVYAQPISMFHVMYGRFGLIPVFPWTTTRDIGSRAAAIRKVIGKVHRDSTGYPKGLIAQWIRSHPSNMGLAPRHEIARAVYGKTTGLERPSLSKAYQTLSDEKEAELFAQYRAKNHTYAEINRKIGRYARGSEAPAVAAVRMAEKKAGEFSKAFYKSMETPEQFDSLAFVLSHLLRGFFLSPPTNRNVLRQYAGQIRDLLLRVGDRSFPRPN